MRNLGAKCTGDRKIQKANLITLNYSHILSLPIVKVIYITLLKKTRVARIRKYYDLGTVISPTTMLFNVVVATTHVINTPEISIMT